MSKLSDSGIKIVQARILVPLAIFLIFVFISFTSFWDGVDRSVYDVLLRIKCSISPPELTHRVVSVDITDEVELNIGSSIESRQAFLDALTVMKKAEVGGGFDFLFSSSKNPKIDSEIALAASGLPGCVLIVVPLSKEETNFSGKELDPEESAIVRRHLWFPTVIHKGKIPVAARFLLPSHALAASAKHLAHAGLISDSDGIYRRVPLLYRWEDGYMPSFPLVMAAEKLGIDTNCVVLDAGHALTLPLKDGRKIRVPIDETGCAFIPYAGLWKNGPRRIPMDTFLSAARDERAYDEIFDVIDGSILCFSDLTTSRKDFGTTPLETVYPLSGIHNSVLNGLLTSTFYRPFPVSLKLAISFLMIACVVFILSRKRDVLFHVFFSASLFLFCATVLFCWFRFFIVPWCCGMIASIFVAWLSSWIFRLADSYRERLLLGNALSRYFPRALAIRILKEGRTELVPAEKELTLLFADISGFTKWSSDKDPETVHGFLSDYLESMAGILFAHGGTVDKFMGDGILAFFGDPFDQEDHTERCVLAAIDMQKKVRELARRWKPLVGIDLKIRIGINSGHVIVGNLGSKTRVEYTVIGAAVNLAQRMEGNAPVGGILVAEDAYVNVSGLCEFSDPQPVMAKGYDKPVQAYEVLEKFE